MVSEDLSSGWLDQRGSSSFDLKPPGGLRKLCWDVRTCVCSSAVEHTLPSKLESNSSSDVFNFDQKASPSCWRCGCWVWSGVLWSSSGHPNLGEAQTRSNKDQSPISVIPGKHPLLKSNGGWTGGMGGGHHKAIQVSGWSPDHSHVQILCLCCWRNPPPPSTSGSHSCLLSHISHCSDFT